LRRFEHLSVVVAQELRDEVKRSEEESWADRDDNGVLCAGDQFIHELTLNYSATERQG
jgi:hypothetical protein